LVNIASHQVFSADYEAVEILITDLQDEVSSLSVGDQLKRA